MIQLLKVLNILSSSQKVCEFTVSEWTTFSPRLQHIIDRYILFGCFLYYIYDHLNNLKLIIKAGTSFINVKMIQFTPGKCFGGAVRKEALGI